MAMTTIFRMLLKKLYFEPRERRKIAENLDFDESMLFRSINQQIVNASKGLQANSNPLWKKVQQNLIDNHARYVLEEYYLNVRKTLSERQDFDKGYVQFNYANNEDKLAALFEERPYIDLDIQNYFSQPVLEAYKKFSMTWFEMTDKSDCIMRYGSPISFPRITFGCVKVGSIPIPSFLNYDGDIIYFFPSFAIILKKDFSIVFYALENISLNLSEKEELFTPLHCPKDAVFVKESWEHSNKDGSRDARYSYNQRYCHYNVAHINVSGISDVFSFDVSNQVLASMMSYNYLNLREALSEKHFKSNVELHEIDIEPIDIDINDETMKKTPYPIFDLNAADPLFVDAVYWILTTHSAMTSNIQRRFSIGYIRAGKIMEEIESAGIISSATTTSRVKEIEFTLIQFHEWLEFQKSVQQATIDSTADNETSLSKRGKHYVGEKHPTKPWVWTEYAPGKFDWRKARTEDADKSVVKPEVKPAVNEDSQATKELNSLIGLSGVKEEIVKLQNFVKIQQARQAQGLKTSPITYHCVFTGNPGTGKTTVARIVAEIYRDMGILKKGHLVETDRSGLVAEYIGQTGPKTNAVIDSALDGVLFIDEAYALVQAYSNDLGYEAVATLLKRMEDDRDRLVVILAGYGNEMKTFIDSNPGLQSRFNRYIHFDDYSADDLLAIFELSLKKQQYRITDSAKAILKTFLDNAVANKDKNFGNGRFVRNIFEKVLQNQATRLASSHNLSKEALQLIIDEDIPAINTDKNLTNQAEETQEIVQTLSDLSERDNIRPKFWKAFIEYNSKHNGPYASTITSGKDNWISKGIGISGMDISAVINGNSCRSQIGINFGEGSDKNKAIFDYLFQRKDEIQGLMPEFPLVWERMDDKIACRIHTDLKESYLLENKRAEIMEFLLKSSNKMIEVFSKYIPQIKKELIIYSEKQS